MKKLKILFTFIFILFIGSPCYSSNISNLQNNFLIFIEKEFLSNNIKTKFNEDLDKFIILDIEKKEYEVSFQIRKKYINQNLIFIPILKIFRKTDGVVFSSSRSLTFEKDANLIEIETIAKMLVNTSINQIKHNGLKFHMSDQKFIDKLEKKIKIGINYFNKCESSKIIDIMEKQFPGFIHLESDEYVSSFSNNILYYTTSTKYKIKKWIEIILNDADFGSKDFSIKINKNKITLNKINKLKYMHICE